MTSPGRLGDRINHVSHIDINVRDAERSLRFYEATMPVESVGRIEGSGSFPSLGIDDGSFVGYALRNSTQLGDYPMLRLIQWQHPEPVGRPYVSHGNVGWYRLVATVRDIERARAAVIAHGGKPFTETLDGLLYMYGPTVEPNPYRTFHAHDPDGITIQWSYDWPREDQSRAKDADAARGRHRWLAERPVQDRIFALVGGTTDLDAHVRFYTDVLGLDIYAGLQTPEPVSNIYSTSGGQTVADGAFFAPRGDRRFVIDWLRWYESAANATPYSLPNHLGILRCAIEVDDLDHAHECLQEAAEAEPGLVGIVHPPEMWELGPTLGRQRVVNFADAEGVMFQLVQARAYPLGTLHPWGAHVIDFDAASVEQSVRRPR